MALSMTLSRALARAPCAVRPVIASRPRTMMIRALKGDKKHEKDEHHQEVQSQEMTTAAPNLPAKQDSSETRMAQRNPQQAMELLMPFRRMTDSVAQMQREMDAIMDWAGLGADFGGRSPFSLIDRLTAPLAAMPRMAASINRMVPLEVQEDETKYTVRVEVPGFTKQDIKVTMDPTTNLLTISGQKEAKEKEGTRAMSFTRSFTLPMDTDMDKQIAARTEHGVLTVELPKAPENVSQQKMKEIPVEGA